MIKVKIPECSNPFEVTINGRKYIYEAGIETDVPDDVAKAIEKHKKAHYKDPHEAKAPFGAISFNNLKDKPFYEIKKDFRTGEIKTNFESGNAFVPLDINPNDFQLEVDTRIIVKWNGIEYPLITKTHSATDYQVYWGNGALLMPMLEDTGEPFFFRKTISGSSLGFNIISTQSSATWEIIVPDYYTELKTLDEKYIPDSVKGRADLEVNWNGSNSPSVYNIVSGTPEELKTKILAGEQIKVNIFSINHIPNNRFFFPVLRVLYNIENNNLEFTVMTDSGTIDKFIISI